MSSNELRDELVSIFKAGWNLANNHGEIGHRTEAGIDAVMQHLAAQEAAEVETVEQYRFQYGPDTFTIAYPSLDELKSATLRSNHRRPLWRREVTTTKTAWRGVASNV